MRTVRWKVERNCPPGFDGLFDAFDHVNACVVHENDIVSFQGRSEELLDVSLERLAIQGALEHKGCGHSIMTQGCDECDGLPVSVQHLLDQPFSLRRPAIEACGRRRYAGFSRED